MVQITLSESLIPGAMMQGGRCPIYWGTGPLCSAPRRSAQLLAEPRLEPKWFGSGAEYFPTVVCQQGGQWESSWDSTGALSSSQTSSPPLCLPIWPHLDWWGYHQFRPGNYSGVFSSLTGPLLPSAMTTKFCYVYPRSTSALPAPLPRSSLRCQRAFVRITQISSRAEPGIGHALTQPLVSG